MREWQRTNLSNVDSPTALRGILQNVDTQMRELTLAVKLLGGGRVPVADNVPLPVSGGGASYHNQLLGLDADDHSQYALLTGRSAGQTIIGISGAHSGSVTGAGLYLLGGNVGGGWNGNVHFTSAPGTGLTLETGAGFTRGAWNLGTSQASGTLHIKSELGIAPAILLQPGNATAGAPIAIYGPGISQSVFSVNAAGRAVFDSYTGQASGTILSVGNTLGATASVPLAVVGHASQTGNLQEWSKSGGTALSFIKPTGVFSTTGVDFRGSAAGTASVVAAATTTSHTLTLPSANATGVLTNNGSGALSWSAGPSHALLDGNVHSDTVYPGALSRGMMTWVDSSGFWGGFALGAANTVLTSDGTDPGWRTLSAAHMDDRTRHFFIPPASFFAGTSTNFHLTPGSNPNAANALAFSGSADTYMYTNVMWPADMASGSSITYTLYFIQRAGSSANSIIWYMYQLKPVIGTTLATDAYDKLDKVTYSTNGGTNVVVTATITSTLVSPAAGDFVRLTLARLASSDGSDTNTNTADLLGVKVSYTADM